MGLYRFTLCYLLNKPIQDRILTPWEEQNNNRVAGFFKPATFLRAIMETAIPEGMAV